MGHRLPRPTPGRGHRRPRHLQRPHHRNRHHVLPTTHQQNHHPSQTRQLNRGGAKIRDDPGAKSLDETQPLMRAVIDHLLRQGRVAVGTIATGVLVETLLDRGDESDVAEAEAAIERLATAPADEGLAMRDIWLLRLRALLAGAQGDDARYREYRDRYRDMARTLGFEGH